MARSRSRNRKSPRTARLASSRRKTTKKPAPKSKKAGPAKKPAANRTYDAQVAQAVSKDVARWRRETLEPTLKKMPARKAQWVTDSGIPIPDLLTVADRKGEEHARIGLPGEFPYTRGTQPSMYRGRLWTMRQFAGFGTPSDTNRRFKYLIEHGVTGLSTAFDMPALMGYDADHPLSQGEVGKEGFSVSSLKDLQI